MLKKIVFVALLMSLNRCFAEEEINSCEFESQELISDLAFVANPEGQDPLISCLSEEDLRQIKLKSTTEKPITKKRFAIVTASYNNIKYVQKYLDSIVCQTYKNYRVVYYSDCDEHGMDDGTGKYVEAYLNENPELKSKFRLVKNTVKAWAHENIFRAIHSLDDDEIVLIVDGDDWLAGPYVLEYLNKVYSDNNVWLTYGSFIKHPNGKLGFTCEVPVGVIQNNSIRSYKWITSHLRTFYAWLYKRIKIEDLILDGKFIRVCGDVAIMLPMIEMAGFHSLFIPKVLYVYNAENSNSYWYDVRKKKASFDIAKDVSSKIRKRQPYKPLLKSDLE